MASKRVREERTGFRDSVLSTRHRLWGWDCPAVDVDFLLIEYDHAKVRALVEYKNEHAAPQKPTEASYRAIRNLGDKAEIPVFACRYASDLSWFRPAALNAIAKTALPTRPVWTELEWVEFLYRLRGRSVPTDVLRVIAETLPESIAISPPPPSDSHVGVDVAKMARLTDKEKPRYLAKCADSRETFEALCREFAPGIFRAPATTLDYFWTVEERAR